MLLYDSRDLVTHGVIVGMTGSGKTGLGIGLIEEAALDSVPVIAIDPKGDLTNLLLTFPDLRGEDFAPWVNADEARKKDISVEEYAGQQAATWKKGLADWGQSGERIRALKDAADFVIYTPGSTAGIPVSILRSFAAPGEDILNDSDLMRERVSTTATSLLGLLGIEADPIQSREHILLSTVLDQAWREGRDLDLAALIQQVQTPPFTRVGVLDLESFYPAKERFGLVMALNNLVASPGFNAWLEGEPLDIGEILYTAEGKPRVSIFSIAHLSDPERMFFVSLLLNQILGWMRSQPGNHQPSRSGLYGRDLWLLSSPQQSARQVAAADTAQASSRLRCGDIAGYSEPGRSGLQGVGEHRHVVCGAIADRAGQGSPVGRAGGGQLGQARVRSPGYGADDIEPRQPGVSDERHP